MSKVVVIGCRADILPFAAAGAQLIEVEDAGQAAAALDGLESEKDACLVMLSEDFAIECAGEVETFRTNRRHALVAIPSLGSPTGRTLTRIRALVARSLGVDLLGRSE